MVGHIIEMFIQPFDKSIFSDFHYHFSIKSFPYQMIFQINVDLVVRNRIAGNSINDALNFSEKLKHLFVIKTLLIFKASEVFICKL